MSGSIPARSPALGLMARHYLRVVLARRAILGLAALVVLIPAATLLARLGAGDPLAALRTVEGEGVLGLLAPLAALVLATAAVLDEHERGTLALLLVRPIPRAVMLLGRLLAAASVCAAATVAVAAFCHVALAAGHGFEVTALLRLAAASILGSLAYVGVFSAFATMLPRATVVGILYILIWEHGLAALPGRAPLFTVRLHAANVAGILDSTASAIPLLPASAPPSALSSAALLAAAAVFSAAVAIFVFRRREWVGGAAG